MVIKHHLVGYKQFSEFFKTFVTKNQTVFVYFTGSKDSNGTSWCPTCNVAWPLVQNEVPKLPDDSHFVVVEVGDRPTWKDTLCPFRTDPKTKLLVVPTLVRWDTPQRLEGSHLEKPELLSMLFFDED